MASAKPNAADTAVMNAAAAAGGRPIDVMVAMRRRRMYRDFEQRPVPRPILERLAWAAGRAQHGRAGVRHLVIVDDARLMKTAREVLPGYANSSTAMIVICSDLTQIGYAGGPVGVEHVSRLDSGAAAAHLALAAQAFGIGTCTVTSWTPNAVRALFDIPEHIRPDITVALGYPAKGGMAAPKGGFGPAVHHNRYGRALVSED